MSSYPDTVEMLRGSVGLLLTVAISACTLPQISSPTPTPTLSPTPTPTPIPSDAPAPSLAASPSPPPAIPEFEAGEIVVTTIDGLRVRSLPGVDRPVVTGLLPLAFELAVVMGPIPIDDLGWYLVADADAREPEFSEGWVAAGSTSDPLLTATGRIGEGSPSVASMAQTGDAEQGPIAIGEGDHAIRWVALDPERARCSFAVSFTPAGGGDSVPAIRATIGTGVDRGTLQPQSFAALNLNEPVFAVVTSDCAWALVITRIPPDASSPAGSPTPSPSP